MAMNGGFGSFYHGGNSDTNLSASLSASVSRPSSSPPKSPSKRSVQRPSILTSYGKPVKPIFFAPEGEYRFFAEYSPSGTLDLKLYSIFNPTKMNYAPSLSSSASEIQELVQQNNSTIVELQGYFLFNISQCLVLDQYFHASRRCLADINAELNSIKIELQFEKPLSSSKFYSSASESNTRYSSNLEKKRIKVAKYEAALDQLEWQASRFPTPQEIQFRVMPTVSVFQDSEIHGNIVNFITGFRSGDILWYSSDRSKVERKVALSSYVPSGRGAASLSDSQSSSSSSSDSPKKPTTTSTSTQKVHFNREGCIEASSVSALAWVPHSSSPTVGDGGQFLVGHTNGLMYLYHFDRKDPPPELVQASTSAGSPHSFMPEARPPPPGCHCFFFQPDERYNPAMRWRFVQGPIHDIQFSPNSVPAPASFSLSESYFSSSPASPPSSSSSSSSTAAAANHAGPSPAASPLLSSSSSSASVTGLIPKYVAVAAQDGRLRVFDWATKKLEVVFRSYFGAFLCVAWSPDGRLLLTGGEDDQICLWSLEQKTLLARGSGHRSWVSAVAFDPYLCSPSVSRSTLFRGTSPADSEKGKGKGEAREDAIKSEAHSSSNSGPLSLSRVLASEYRQYRFGSVCQGQRLILWEYLDDSAADLGASSPGGGSSSSSSSSGSGRPRTGSLSIKRSGHRGRTGSSQGLGSSSGSLAHSGLGPSQSLDTLENDFHLVEHSHEEETDSKINSNNNNSNSKGKGRMENDEAPLPAPSSSSSSVVQPSQSKPVSSSRPAPSPAAAAAPKPKSGGFMSLFSFGGGSNSTQTARTNQQQQQQQNGKASSNNNHNNSNSNNQNQNQQQQQLSSRAIVTVVLEEKFFVPAVSRRAVPQLTPLVEHRVDGDPLTSLAFLPAAIAVGSCAARVKLWARPSMCPAGAGGSGPSSGPVPFGSSPSSGAGWDPVLGGRGSASSSYGSASSSSSAAAAAMKGNVSGSGASTSAAAAAASSSASSAAVAASPKSPSNAVKESEQAAKEKESKSDNPRESSEAEKERRESDEDEADDEEPFFN